MEGQTDITKLSIQELKALAYDQLVVIENAQKNIKMINEEIVKKSALPATVVTEQ